MVSGMTGSKTKGKALGPAVSTDLPVGPGRTYRSAESGRYYKRNTVAAARVAVAANKKAKSDVPSDILDMARAVPVADPSMPSDE